MFVAADWQRFLFLLELLFTCSREGLAEFAEAYYIHLLFFSPTFSV